VREAIELVGKAKLWIQLCVPPIESGGQFNVGVIVSKPVVWVSPEARGGKWAHFRYPVFTGATC
jgi:hypothetical protein